MKKMMKKLFTGMIAVIMIVAMLMTCIPQVPLNVFAAEPIAIMNSVNYYDYNTLVSAISSKKGETLIIDMLKDWDRKDDSHVNERIIVPSDCSLTLNMHGHMINRRLTKGSDYTTNGELFLLKWGANVTINGGAERTQHTVNVHSSTAKDKYATTEYTTLGGTLSGGSSTNGAGCFHMYTFSTLTLNNVTIAGCRAEQRGGRDGYGGAIYLESDAGGNGNCKIRLTDSLIYGCYAYNDGGAIYSNGPENEIKLRRSSIENNYCGGDGGAFYYNYAATGLSGDGKSSIKGNTAAGDGGAIYVDEEELSIAELNITGNHAAKGGAIYINDEETVISSCVITDNSANDGGGVYVYKNITDLTVKGATVIKDNGHNLYISDTDPDDTRVQFNLTKGADVHVRYYTTGGKDSIMVSPGKIGDTIKTKNCIRFLTSDNKDYHFYFGPAPNDRKIYLKKGAATEIPAPEKVRAVDANNASGKKKIPLRSTESGKVGTVGPGGIEGDEYDLIRGFYMHEDTDSGTVDNTGLFYYTDAFFDESVDPNIYNEHLATSSWSLAFAGTYLRKFDTSDAHGNRYYDKHAGARQFLADIGCPDQKIYVNESMVSKPGTDTVGCTIGSKELAKADGTKTGKILIPVTVRGGGYESEWASNCTLGAGTDDEGRDGEAKGFSTAADQVVESVDEYISKYGLEDEISAGNVVFWVTGFSRAGATANITSKRLVEKYADGTEGKNNRVFGYTCEAAKGGTDKAQKLTAEKYYCIHNMINTADVVPLVAPWQMGFKRYGVDHYVPGTAAGEIKAETKEVKHAGSSGITQVTAYADNKPLKTKSGDYDKLRDGTTAKYGKSIFAHLRAIDPDIIFDDYFHPMSMNLAPSIKFYENGDYDGNCVEDFLEDFFRGAQEGIPEEKMEWSVTIGSRKKWAEDKTKINNKEYPTIQEAMRDTMAMVFNMDEEHSQSFMEKASDITNHISTIGGDVSKLELYELVIRGWHTRTEKEKEHYVTILWDKLKATGALDALKPDDASKLEKNWPTLADFIFHLVESDHSYLPGKHTDISKWAKGMDENFTYIPTFVTYSSYILTNHYPEVNIAWVRMNDDWYKDEEKRLDFKEYKIEPPQNVAIPGVYAIESGEGEEPAEKELIPDNKNANVLTGDQRIIMANKNIVGEAIYYDVKDVTEGEAGEIEPTYNIYFDGLDLTLDGESKKIYKIYTFDMSYGVKSDMATYYINLIDDKHEVIVKNPNQGGEDRTYEYREGDVVHVNADILEDRKFTSWTVTDENNINVTSRIFAGDYAGLDKSANTEFRMPASDDASGFSKDYALTFTANYDDKISNINVAVGIPVYDTAQEEGEPLDETATATFNTIEGKTFSYPVTWTYEAEGKEYIATGNALPATEYTAHITIPQGEKMPDEGEAEMIAFAKNVTAGAVSGEVSCRRMSGGSVQIAVKFPATAGIMPVIPPVAINKLTIKAYDVNLNDYLDEDNDIVCYVVPGTTVTVSARAVEDESFVQWNMLESGITIASGQAKDRTVGITIPSSASGGEELIICAGYSPVINSMEVVLTAPVGGEEMAATVDSMKVKITKEYAVDPECVNVRWTPAPKKVGGKDIAAFEIPYTAVVTLKPYTEGDHSGRIKVKDKDGHEIYISATFGYADNITVTMNGEPAYLDKRVDAVSHTFPATGYELAADVKNPADITGLPHDTDIAGIKSRLPETIKVLRNDGMEVDAKVVWGDPTVTYPSGDERGSAVWTASGRVKLPGNMINPTDAEHPDGKYRLDVSMTLTTQEAAYAASPVSSLPSGAYRVDQQTTLSTSTEGGKIYYTLDGSDPAVSGILYDGTPILIDFDQARGKTSITLRAYTVKEGMWDSAVANYTYTLDNVIPVPAGETFDYIGAEWTLLEASKFYTVVEESLPKGCRINDNGDLVAKDLGTYKVTLHIGDDYVWESGTEGETTKEDQEVTFMIIGTSLSDAVITVLIDPYPFVQDPDHPEIMPEPPVRVTLMGEEVPAENYDVVYAPNESGEKPWKVKAIGKGSYADETDWAYFDISDDVETFTYEKIPDQTYTGKAIKPQVKVYFAGKPMKEKKDYTISYKDNVKASANATFIIKGKGNYSGTASGTFTILPRHVLDDGVSMSEINSVVYNPKKPKIYKPVPKLTYNRMSLKKDRDFTVKYYTDEMYTTPVDEPKEPGHYYAVIEGMGNYTGSGYQHFDILEPSLKPVSTLKIGRIPDQPYTGEPVDVKDLNLVIKDGTKTLVMGEDYEAGTWSIDAGIGLVTITGIEEKGYSGIRRVYYNITGIPMSKVTVIGLPKTVEYDGTQQKPEFTLSYKKDTKSVAKPISYITKEKYDCLSPDEQKKIGCLVSYGENKNVGRGTVTLTGINECSGTVHKSFKITGYDITPEKDTVDLFKVTLSQESYAFAKAGVKPKPVVMFKGVPLNEGTDYTLAYSNNKKLNDLSGRDKPTVKVSGKGSFTGTDATTFFKIVQADMEEEGISVTANDVVYKDKAGNWMTKVTVVDRDGRKLTAGKDYDKDIRFTSDAAGENPIPKDAKLDPGTVVYVTVKAKEGSAYTGSVTGTYRIIKNDISKLSASIGPKTYTGEEVRLEKKDIIWKQGSSPVDLPEENYEIVESSYKNNVNKGKTAVTVRGTGDEWGGSKTLTFTIGPRGFLWWWRNLMNL